MAKTQASNSGKARASSTADYAQAPQVPIARLFAMAFRELIDDLHSRLEAQGWRDTKSSYGFILIAARDNTSSVNDVAALLGVSKQAASKLVEALQESGYIRLVANPEDARSKHLVLTRKGERFLGAVEGIYRDLEQEWVDVLGARAVEALRGDIERVLRSRHAGQLPAIKPVW